MKRLLYAALISLIAGSVNAQMPMPNLNMHTLVSSKSIDVNNDGLKDYTIFYYDSNRNCVPDIQAWYSINRSTGIPLTGVFPTFIKYDTNEDGIPDRELMDSDSDGLIDGERKLTTIVAN